ISLHQGRPPSEPAHDGLGPEPIVTFWASRSLPLALPCESGGTFAWLTWAAPAFSACCGPRTFRPWVSRTTQVQLPERPSYSSFLVRRGIGHGVAPGRVPVGLIVSPASPAAGRKATPRAVNPGCRRFGGAGEGSLPQDLGHRRLSGPPPGSCRGPR